MSFLKKVAAKSEGLKVRLKEDAKNVGILTFKTPDGTKTFKSWDDFAARGKGTVIKDDLWLTSTDSDGDPGDKVAFPKKLPEDLTILGDFVIEDVQRLRSLPKGLKVKNLMLWECAIRTLPPDIQIEQTLEVRHTPLTSLPGGLKVKTMTIDGCRVLKTIGPGLQVQKNAYFSYCPDLRALPRGLKVGGMLSLKGTFLGLEEPFGKSDILGSIPRDAQIGQLVVTSPDHRLWTWPGRVLKRLLERRSQEEGES